MNARGVALLVLLGLASAQAQIVSKKDLVTAVSENADLSALYAAVGAYPDLVEQLKTFTGTVFAPNNKAFEEAFAAAKAAGVELDKATVETILKYHLVPEAALLKADLTDGQELTTLADQPLKIRYVDGDVSVEAVGSTANVLKEMKVGPAAVHIIDAVLLPIKLPAPAPAAEPTPAAPEEPQFESIVEAAEAANLTMLIGAVSAAGLADTFGPDFNGTVFAPTNEAFAELIAALGPALNLESPTQKDIDLLTSVLLYHVVPDAAVLSSELTDGQEITTANGQIVTVSLEDGDVYLLTATDQKVKVVMADVKAGNAVAHVIDAVMLPVLEAAAPAPAPEAVSGADSSMASLAVLAGSLLAAALAL